MKIILSIVVSFVFFSLLYGAVADAISRLAALIPG